MYVILYINSEMQHNMNLAESACRINPDCPFKLISLFL